MPFDYVSDYEDVTGQKIPTDAEVEARLLGNVEAKVIAAPTVRIAEPATVAEVKTEGE